MAQKNPQTFHSLKIKIPEKQKCVTKLFLLKSKILKIELQNLRKFAKLQLEQKIANFLITILQIF